MSAVTTDQRPRAKDLLERMSPDFYRQAYERNQSLSAYLESIDPSEGYNDGLDAFGRLLKEAGIRTKTMPEYGIYADKFDKFEQSDKTRTLAYEWIARQWRRAQTGRDVSTRSLYSSTDQVPGSPAQPFINAAQARTNKQIAPAIPLEELVAITTPIEGAAYQAFYLQDNVTEQQMVRVGEGDEVPTAKLVGSKNLVQLRKFGRALESSYETLRRMRFDMVELHIARMAVQAESDKVAAVIDTLVNGDGNASTAATVHNLTALDAAATVGTLTLKAWIAFKMKFANPYMASVALAQEDPALQLLMLNTGSANIPLVMVQGMSGFGTLRQINPGLADGVGLGWTSAAPASKIVAFDGRFAVERVTEIGGSLTEVEKFVSKQTQKLVMTEVEGYCIFDPSAARVLNLGA